MTNIRPCLNTPRFGLVFRQNEAPAVPKGSLDKPSCFTHEGQTYWATGLDGGAVLRAHAETINGPRRGRNLSNCLAEEREVHRQLVAKAQTPGADIQA